MDNCISVGNNEAGTVPNSGGLLKAQLDADGDGYGNFCDADINNSGKDTTADYTRLRNVLNRPYDFNADSAAADMNGSGTGDDRRLHAAAKPAQLGAGAVRARAVGAAQAAILNRGWRPSYNPVNPSW